MSVSGARLSRIRRSRGYRWEDAIVKRFNELDGWSAFRLGSPSTHLPDVLAVNTSRSAIFVIEAKSGTSQSLYVPAEQIRRCAKWLDIFDIYEQKAVILAFKFSAKKRVGAGRYRSRTLREYFKARESGMEPVDCACGYDGLVRLRSGEPAPLPDHPMPFAVQGAS